MKNIKRILICLIFLSLVACSKKGVIQNDAKEHSIYNYIDEIKDVNVIIDLKTSVELNNEYTPEYMLSQCDSVVLASVISIDESSMEFNSVIGYTYGKMLIQDVYYGNINKNTVIEYAKPGAIMISKTEYDASQPEKFQDKLNHLDAGTNKYVYYSLLIENDIEIKTGLTYLAYLKYSNAMNKYEIIGLGNGLREVNIPHTNTIIFNDSLINLEIKNNNTNKWEILNTYIDYYLNKRNH